MEACKAAPSVGESMLCSLMSLFNFYIGLVSHSKRSRSDRVGVLIRSLSRRLPQKRQFRQGIQSKQVHPRLERKIAVILIVAKGDVTLSLEMSKWPVNSYTIGNKIWDS